MEAHSSQSRQANVANVSNPDLDFEEEDYAPSDQCTTATVTHSPCFTTMLQQPQPLSFEAMDIRPDMYPLPRVALRMQETPATGV